MKNVKIYQKTISKIMACALSIVLSASLTGCAKKMQCNIKEPHAQKYVDDKGFVAYYQSEYEFVNNYKWTDDFRYLNNDFKEKQDFLEKNNLLLIADNVSPIKSVVEVSNDYIEYEYGYTMTFFLPISSGKTTIFMPIISTRIGYSKDSNVERKTGKVRDAHYVYYGYRIAKENGKWQAEKSNASDNLFNINSEYPYFKRDDFCQVIYSEVYDMPKTLTK